MVDARWAIIRVCRTADIWPLDGHEYPHRWTGNGRTCLSHSGTFIYSQVTRRLSPTQPLLVSIPMEVLPQDKRRYAQLATNIAGGMQWLYFRSLQDL